MKILWPLTIAVLMMFGYKSEVNISTPSSTNQNDKLIKSYSVDNKWECFYSYNDDKTLKEIVFKTDGTVKCTQVFTYKNGKIVETLKQDVDGANAEKKQFEYKGEVIVKEIMHLDGKLYETSQFKYDGDKFLKRITTEKTVNRYKSSKIITIEKLAENKIKVKRTGVAIHVITYDNKLTPAGMIPGYEPLAQISNKGIVGNILLTEIYTGKENKPSTTITSKIKYGNDGKTVLSSKVTYSSSERNFLETQEFKYNY